MRDSTQRTRFHHAFSNHPVNLSARGIGVLSVLIAGLVIAGCGSSDSSTTTTAALSKADFVAQANAICDKGNAQTQQLANQTFTNNKPTQAQITAFTTGQVANIQAQIDQITALGAPSGDEQTVSQMLDLAQQDVDKLKNDPSAAKDNHLFDNFVAVAHPYGLTTCAKGS